MNKKQSVFLLPILSIFLAACGSFAASPTPTPTHTPEPTLTASPIPTETPTPEPTATLIPSATPTSMASATPTRSFDDISVDTLVESIEFPIPSDTPLTEWRGIPIMSAAIAGKSTPNGYLYTIDSPIVQVKSFYDNKLGQLGWESPGLTITESKNAIGFFLKEGILLTVSIIKQDDLTFVFLIMLEE